MNCFELVKDVLDEAYHATSGSEPEKDAKIQQAMADLRKGYAQVWQTGGPDYADPVRRFAYVYTYVTSYANLVYSIIRNVPGLESLFDRNEVAVACLGGGPGSDLVGILKYLTSVQKDPAIQCHICDREDLWSESWSDVGKRLGYPKLQVTYLPQDVCGTKWQQQFKYLAADLFTVVYFVSEVYARRSEAEAYFDNVLKKAKSGAYFIFVDNDHSLFTGWFDRLVAENGLKELRRFNGTMKMPFDEEKTALGPYLTKFGSLPRLEGAVAYRVVVKP